MLLLHHDDVSCEDDAAATHDVYMMYHIMKLSLHISCVI